MKCIFVVLFFLLFFSFIFAEDIDTNTNTVDVFNPSVDLVFAKDEIKLISSDIKIMGESGFSVARVNDELFIIKQIYENNYSKEKNKEYVNNSVLIEKINNLKSLIKQAYLLKDELLALELELDKSSEELDVSSAKEIFLIAKQEFDDERYELVISYVDKSYERLSELQSLSAKTSAAYEATRKSLTNFIMENWQILLTIILTPIILYIIFRKKIKCYLLNKKLNSNNYEIEILKNEIKKSQEKYFIDGKLPESEYEIKISLYSEKIRNLNKDNALLIEKIEKRKCSKKLKNKNKNV